MGMNSNVAVTNLEKIKQINSRLDSKNIDEVEKSVKSILDSVMDSGNEALKELTSKFDSYELSDDDLKGISPKGYFEKLEPKPMITQSGPDLRGSRTRARPMDSAMQPNMTR